MTEEKENTCVLGTFEENGLKFERIMICLPEPIINYFRAVAIANDEDVGLFEGYIEKTIAESLQSRFEDNEDIKKDLNLSKAFKRVLGDEE